MIEDHIAVKIDGALYVKFDDVKPMRDRIVKLEAALRSVLRYQLTDETWGMLGFDPKKIRAEFDAARNALEGKE